MATEIGTVTTRFAIEGADAVVNENRRIISELSALSKQGITSGKAVKELSKALNDNMAATRATQRAISGIRMTTRTAYSDLIEFNRVMRGVGSIGQTSLSMWQAYTIGIYRVDQASRQLGEATKDQAFWQNKVNEYMQEFGKDSPYTQDALSKLDDAKTKAKDLADELKRAQESMNLGYLTMGLNVPSFISDIVNIGLEVGILTKLIAGSGGLVPSLALLKDSLINAFKGGFIEIAPYLSLLNPALAPVLAAQMHGMDVTVPAKNAVTQSQNMPWYYGIPFAGQAFPDPEYEEWKKTHHLTVIDDQGNTAWVENNPKTSSSSIPKATETWSRSTQPTTQQQEMTSSQKIVAAAKAGQNAAAAIKATKSGSATPQQAASYIKTAMQAAGLHSDMKSLAVMSTVKTLGWSSSQINAIMNAIPQFAQGAYVNQPTLALFGEKGAEWALPDKKLRDTIREETSSRPIQANVRQNNYITNMSDAKAAGEEAYRVYLEKVAEGR